MHPNSTTDSAESNTIERMRRIFKAQKAAFAAAPYPSAEERCIRFITKNTMIPYN